MNKTHEQPMTITATGTFTPPADQTPDEDND